MLGALNIYSRLSSDYYIADIALEYLNDDTLIVLSTQSKHFKDKTYNLLFKRQQYTRHINKSYKKLTIIPKEIKYLRNVKYLYLSHNRIREIPKTIGQLTKLEELYLSNNQLQTIPESIGQLTNLVNFSLSNNQIREIPETISKLINLRYLYLYNNQIYDAHDVHDIHNVYETPDFLLKFTISQRILDQIRKIIRPLTNLKSLIFMKNLNILDYVIFVT